MSNSHWCNRWTFRRIVHFSVWMKIYQNKVYESRFIYKYLSLGEDLKQSLCLLCAAKDQYAFITSLGKLGSNPKKTFRSLILESVIYRSWLLRNGWIHPWLSGFCYLGRMTIINFDIFRLPSLSRKQGYCHNRVYMRDTGGIFDGLFTHTSFLILLHRYQSQISVQRWNI